jgi:hypothetical protein
MNATREALMQDLVDIKAAVEQSERMVFGE